MLGSLEKAARQQWGSDCRLINPWPGKKVTFYRNGKKSENKSGNMLILSTKTNEKIQIIPGNL